jgi:hypothetical protein
MSDFREQWEFNRATAELAHERDFARHERLDNYTVESGQNAIKAVGIINGGAAVAFVALMGNIVDSDVLKQIDRELIARCFLIFSGGVVLSAMASGLSYVTHYCHTGQNANQILNFEHPYVHETPKSRRWKIAGAPDIIAEATTNIEHVLIGVISQSLRIFDDAGQRNSRDKSAGVGRLDNCAGEPVDDEQIAVRWVDGQVLRVGSANGFGVELSEPDRWSVGSTSKTLNSSSSQINM